MAIFSKKTTTKKAKAPAEKKAAAPAKKETTGVNARTYRVIVKPFVTEKSAIAQSTNKYTFMVASWATKQQVKTAVQELYGVMPVAVNVVNVEGHRVRSGRGQGKRSDFKKAIVTVAKGQSITVHEGV